MAYPRLQCYTDSTLATPREGLGFAIGTHALEIVQIINP